jgi:hypothetical protein
MLQEVLEMSFMFTDIKLSSASRRNLQSFKDSSCNFYFTCKLLNLKPLFLSNADGMVIDFAFQISADIQSINRENSSQVSMQARNRELHIRDRSRAQDDFRTASGSIDDCNVVEHRCVETTREEAHTEGHLPVIHLSIFKENLGNRNH